LRHFPLKSILLAMPLEVEKCECKILVSYWLAKIDVIKKSAKMLHCPLSNLQKSFPSLSKQNQCISRIFSIRLVWIRTYWSKGRFQ
jgi:hypothetical protein